MSTELSKHEKVALKMFGNGPIALPDMIGFRAVESLGNRGLLRFQGARAELTDVGRTVLRSLEQCPN